MKFQHKSKPASKADTAALLHGLCWCQGLQEDKEPVLEMWPTIFWHASEDGTLHLLMASPSPALLQGKPSWAKLAQSKRSKKDSKSCVVMQVTLTLPTWASSVLQSIVKSRGFSLLKLGTKIICTDPHNEKEMVIGSVHKILEWFGLEGIF